MSGPPAARLPPERAWRALVAHSWRLGLAWLARGARRRRWPRPREGLYRLLVPLEPWRYWELARVAREPFAGRCLDVGSPKLLASMLDRRGRGRWVALDLLDEEIARWRAVDPALDLRVGDARALPFPDGAFDAIACVSVVEHVPGDGDARSMAEMWRVLRPGGVLHLTTNAAGRPHEVLTDRPVYGAASVAVGERAFFERRYGEGEVEARLLDLPWEVLAREAARERRPVHARFFAARPWSFLAGCLLPLVCPRNFAPVGRMADLRPGEHAALYLRLRRPGAASRDAEGRAA